MATQAETLKLEAELFARTPRHLLEAWVANESLGLYRVLAEGTDMVAIHRAQGQVYLLEKLTKLSRQHNAQ